MMNDRILLYCSCLFFGFLVGRATVVEKEIVKHVKGETIRDTVMLKADTVKIPREINLKQALVIQVKISRLWILLYPLKKR